MGKECRDCEVVDVVLLDEPLEIILGTPDTVEGFFAINPSARSKQFLSKFAEKPEVKDAPETDSHGTDSRN